MRLTRIVISVLLAGMLSIPAMASSDWVDDFLHRFDPKPGSSPSQPANAPQANLAQLLRTGEVPITLNDVINVMIDTTWRFAPTGSHRDRHTFSHSCFIRH